MTAPHGSALLAALLAWVEGLANRLILPNDASAS